MNNSIRWLEPYAIEPGSLTVSGISAGGAMATQFHVAFSKDVNGVGIFAGSKLKNNTHTRLNYERIFIGFKYRVAVPRDPWVVPWIAWALRSWRPSLRWLHAPTATLNKAPSMTRPIWPATKSTSFTAQETRLSTTRTANRLSHFTRIIYRLPTLPLNSLSLLSIVR